MNAKEIRTALKSLAHKAVDHELVSDDYAELCRSLNVSKMYYDMDVGERRYLDPDTNQLIVSSDIVDGKVILYDEHTENDLVMQYTYYYGDIEYVHAFIEFPKGITKESLDLPMYEFMADQIFLMVSRQNLRYMLDFAEMFDDATCIPNIRYLQAAYNKAIKKESPDSFTVVYINLRNFKYINEFGGVISGDEAIVKYARMLYSFAGPNECVCRMGGDNFVTFIHNSRLDELLETVKEVKIGGLSLNPEKEFIVSAWVGISPPADSEYPINIRIEHASTAYGMGKHRYRKPINYYTSELSALFRRGREITAMFRPAVFNHEFVPFFQPKVNMLTGELIGMEALCRWKHGGSFIYPDQFIPVLDQQGLIHDLDMTILSETCAAIKKWLEMGIEPPRISVNISRKNLFIPNIEKIITDIIASHGIETSRLEVEITETSKEDEFGRLIEFLARLKQSGLKISIDDFGTGYSSLSLIHNINADIVKIDKSFVSSLFSDTKSEILIETIINIANRLDMDIIAEGIETPEEGRALIKMGCINAQGYLYSRPVDFDSATGIIKNNGYTPL